MRIGSTALTSERYDVHTNKRGDGGGTQTLTGSFFFVDACTAQRHHLGGTNFWFFGCSSNGWCSTSLHRIHVATTITFSAVKIANALDEKKFRYPIANVARAVHRGALAAAAAHPKRPPKLSGIAFGVYLSNAPWVL
jgi:hypothetical protein